MGEDLTRWSVRLALVLYFGFAAVRLKWPGDRHQLARGLWTAACLAYLAHVALAFGVFHHWSHAEAYEHTARRTEETTGLDWGGGIFFNYALTALWLADVSWWWLSPRNYADRATWIGVALHSFMLFMIVNAAVVFETGPTRWLSLLALTVLFALWAGRKPAGVGTGP